jgi:hypothetical protein
MTGLALAGLFAFACVQADVFIQEQSDASDVTDVETPILQPGTLEPLQDPETLVPAGEAETVYTPEDTPIEPVDVSEDTAGEPDANLPVNPLETAVVEGYGAVIYNNIAAARDAALADARRRAVEQVAGVRLFTTTEIAHGIMLRDDVTVETIGLVLDSEILEQGLLGEGLYRVLAQVTVATDPLQAAMFRFAPRDRIALYISSADDVIPVTPVVERLAANLMDAGYTIIDPDRSTPDDHHDTWQAYKTGALQVLPLLGPVWECPALLHGDIHCDEPEPGSFGYRCRGGLEMKLVSTHTGDILKQFRTGDPLTGVGKTAAQAVSDLARRLAERAGNTAVESLVPDSATTVRLRVKNLPDETQYRDLASHILSLRFVRAIQNREAWNAWLTRFDVVVESGASVLADELKRHPKLTVLSVTENELELHFENE